MCNFGNREHSREWLIIIVAILFLAVFHIIVWSIGNAMCYQCDNDASIITLLSSFGGLSTCFIFMQLCRMWLCPSENTTSESEFNSDDELGQEI